MKMDVFQGNYKIYYSVMCLAGLWPYDDSSITKFKRIFFSVVMVLCVMNQIMTITNIEPSLYEIVVLISFSCPVIMASIRYISSISTFPTIKFMIDNMQHDYVTLKDPIEVQMLMKDSIVAKRIITLYFALTCTGSVLGLGMFGVSTVLQSNAQIRCLWLSGHYYNERSLHTDLTCLLILMAMTYGVLTFVCTEGTITVLSVHVSGLLNIASYRMVNAIDEAKNSGRSKILDIRPAVEMHRRAIEQIRRYTEDVLLPSLVIMIVAIVSFGVNIYRLFKGIVELRENDNILFSIQFVLAHLAFVYGDNYSGQLLLDSGDRITHEIYNSLWYRLPPKMQKLMLFTLIRMQNQLEINLAGLFVPCFEGFSMMMSTSFSYFTLLCSV